jgi:hypothetical protein
LAPPVKVLLVPSQQMINCLVMAFCTPAPLAASSNSRLTIALARRAVIPRRARLAFAKISFMALNSPYEGE